MVSRLRTIKLRYGINMFPQRHVAQTVSDAQWYSPVLPHVKGQLSPSDEPSYLACGCATQCQAWSSRTIRPPGRYRQCGNIYALMQVDMAVMEGMNQQANMQQLLTEATLDVTH